MSKTTKAICILAVTATFAYCWAVWYFAAMFSVLAVQESGSYAASMLSVVLLAPIPGTFFLHSIQWWLLAFISLGIALKCTLSSATTDAAAMPLVGHAFYLVMISCLHVVGMLGSVIATAAVLG